MELTMITIKKIVEMFLILLIGVIAFKTNIIDSAANKRLSGLLMKVISPAMLFMSYQIEFQQERLMGLALTAVISAVSFFVSIVLVNLLIRGKDNDKADVERMSVIYSNCGFIGIPLMAGIAGNEGVFYITAYITVFNIFIWSHGMAMMSGAASFKTMLRKLVQPATIAILFGIICFLNRIHLPELILEPVSMVGDMNTPVAMLVAGCSLAESNLAEALKRRRTYWVSFIKLIVMPMATIAILAFVPAFQLVKLAVMIAVSCPAAAMTTMFALQYDRDSNYASELFTITTVLSLITIPLVVLMGNSLIG